MPSRGGLRENPKATAKKEAQKSALLRKQKRKPTPSDDGINMDSTDDELVVLQPKKKRSKLSQQELDGGDDGNVSGEGEDITNASEPEIEEGMSEVMLTRATRPHNKN